MGIWNHWQPVTTALNVPDFDSLLKAWLGHCWATNHTILMQWLKLHTHPKLLVHQCGAHIRCLNHFICSGRACGTIGNPLPLPLLIQILTFGCKLGSHCSTTNHTIMQWLRLHTHPKLLAHECGALILWCMNHFVCSGWAYGTIGNPVPPPLLSQILTVG